MSQPRQQQQPPGDQGEDEGPVRTMGSKGTAGRAA